MRILSVSTEWCWRFPLLFLTGLFLGQVSGSTLRAGEAPAIEDIQLEASNIVVVVSVPDGVKRVVLESRSRMEAGAWIPVASKQVAPGAGTLQFTLGRKAGFEALRARADYTLPLPVTSYQGTNRFAGGPTNYVDSWLYRGGVLSPTEDSGGNGAAAREVVESDIWKVDGDRLIFFNQYRGLQIIDIAQPDSARISGTLELPAAGEQMYLRDSKYVVLLVGPSCNADSQNSSVMIVDIASGTPMVVTNLTVPGYIQESRMVGTALYVASQTYTPVSNSPDRAWEWGTTVSSFDLADPRAPEPVGSEFYPGYGNAIAATDTFLFVVTSHPTNWWQSTVQILDITSPEGKVGRFGAVSTAGRVNDKFKMQHDAGVLTIISEDWKTTLITRLETFRVPDPRSAGPLGIVRLGSLELGRGERLHATRFDGSRVYIVTFFQIDPLWIVDLSQPENPRIAGELEVPGWSTYIHPMGDQLVSVGVETNRVAVSLFDVADPARPSLLSRVLLGQNHSWSEANYDEKAFAVLESAGLILVPYSGDTTNGYTSSVQLIDLSPTKLVARGIIEHRMSPRRATYTHDRVLSLSGYELLTVNAVDRDRPAVTSQLALAWPVGRVIQHGEFVLEFGNSDSWFAAGDASIRIAPAGDPNRILRTMQLASADPISGVELRDGLLYVLQQRAGYYYYPPPGEEGQDKTPNVTLTVLDASKLPDLAVLGQTSLRVEGTGWGGDWKALWPKPGVLVWSGGGASGWPWIMYDVAMPMWRGGFWQGYGGGGQLVGFDVATPAVPAAQSVVNLNTNGGWGFSEPFLESTRVYLSEQAQDLADGKTNWWVQRSFLTVVDYADPANPTLRPRVNIPGRLIGISHSGEMLYTQGVHWTNGVSDGREWIDALAYDGVEAHQVASLGMPDQWPQPVLVAAPCVYLGRPGSSGTGGDKTPHRVEIWRVDDSGAFTRSGGADLAQPAYSLTRVNGLLAVQSAYTSIELFNSTDPAVLAPLASHAASSCMWYDLEHADGNPAEGLWIPLGAYGVLRVPIPQ